MVKSSSSPKDAKPTSSSAAATQRYVCVHGHFYQPPRENPWLETVEVEESAAPYHDWNERISAECYAPNGASRITNRKGEIVRIVNNYERMSYNFGPTLLKWMAEKTPRTYRTVLDADRTSAQRYGGHGSAIAQVYNHIILPLASRRDAVTQVRWGIADFEHRFGRRPEGMWLAETAVNREVLDLMAAEGIKFTILAPHQCARVRPIRVSSRQPTTDNRTTINPGFPLPTPRSIRPILTWSGSTKEEASRSSSTTAPPRAPSPSKACSTAARPSAAACWTASTRPRQTPADRAQLSHVATDGESYGHHHKYGEMALSYAMHWIESNGHATLTNYGEFLEKFPPEWEAEVVENTSWSCVHGVERWRANCGCYTGKPGFNQQWRAPLREALDFLRDATAPLAEALAAPSAARPLERARRLHPHRPRPLAGLHRPLLRTPRQASHHARRAHHSA